MKKQLVIQEDKWSKSIFTIKGKYLVIENKMYEPIDDSEKELFEGASSIYAVPLKELKNWLNNL